MATPVVGAPATDVNGIVCPTVPIESGVSSGSFAA
ncbi:hypothetical protein BN9982_200023 [Mycobacterium tuberculosis]|nr:hypothetical protein BN9982_200023 [Mycobacterium tuberculosis]